MGDWKNVEIGEYIDLISGYAFKSKEFLETKEDNSLPIIKIKNVANGDVNLDNVQYHYYEEYLNKFRLSKGDVLIAMTGNHPQARSQVVGGISRYKLNVDALLNQRVGKVKCRENADLDFIYYFLKSNFAQNYLANQSSGSANQANISKTDILSIPIKIPLLPEQKAIANILSSLDNKIDLLHRQNKTLEAMAETLFREWFVERAEDDWGIDILSNIGRIITGKTPSTKNDEYWGSDIDFITPTDFKNYGKYSTVVSRYLSESGKSKVKNSILPKNSILVTCIGSDMGKVTIASNECVTNQQINSLVLKSDLPLHEYIYQHLKSIYPLLRSMALGGTTMPIINKGDFGNIKVTIPPFDILKEFNKITDTYNGKIINNTFQIQTLENLRDTLLPKLMSGKVRVKY